jgi:hypothetical protein
LLLGQVAKLLPRLLIDLHNEIDFLKILIHGDRQLLVGNPFLGKRLAFHQLQYCLLLEVIKMDFLQHYWSRLVNFVALIEYQLLKL